MADPVGWGLDGRAHSFRDDRDVASAHDGGSRRVSVKARVS
jgi:hypothetical protein